MASIGRSVNALRATALRSRGASLPKPSTPLRSFPSVRRSVVSALGSVESLMPLHSAIASARLRSFIASDSSYWSCLSQGYGGRTDGNSEDWGNGSSSEAYMATCRTLGYYWILKVEDSFQACGNGYGGANFF